MVRLRPAGVSLMKMQQALMLLAGVLILLNIFTFLSAPDYFQNAAQRAGLKDWTAALVVIAAGGFGVETGRQMLRRDRRYLWPALVYCALFLLLQIFMIVFTEAVSCKCQTLSESIANITDWRRLYPAVIGCFLAGTAILTGMRSR